MSFAVDVVVVTVAVAAICLLDYLLARCEYPGSIPVLKVSFMVWCL